MPRKPKPPLFEPLIQGLSDHRTMGKTAVPKFEPIVDEIAGGSPEPIQPKFDPSVDVPTYVRTAPMANRSKRAALDAAVKLRAKQLGNASRIILGLKVEPELPMPKHNQVHTESKLVLSVPRNPNAIKRRF